MALKEVIIEGEGIQLPGLYHAPEKPSGLVIFAHGSGSGRLSPRNQQVAQSLVKAGMATLLFDLLTEAESADRRNVFDIELLARRLQLATVWARKNLPAGRGPIGYFGASTGAAAALLAASRLGEGIAAVASRGGRPDMAMPVLPQVTAPTLLLVGGHDYGVIELNREAAALLPHCETVIVPGATHLFEEPGTLEQVCQYAADWFTRYLLPSHE